MLTGKTISQLLQTVLEAIINQEKTMSIERVNNFRDQVNTDPALQDEVLSLLLTERRNGVAALGNKYGFTVRTCNGRH